MALHIHGPIQGMKKILKKQKGCGIGASSGHLIADRDFIKQKD